MSLGLDPDDLVDALEELFCAPQLRENRIPWDRSVPD